MKELLSWFHYITSVLSLNCFHYDFDENRFLLFLIIHAINWVVKIKSPFYQGIESASSPGLYSLDVQYFRRTVFPRELGPGGTVFPKGIRSAGPKIGPDRIPYDTGLKTLMQNKIIGIHVYISG